MPELLPGLNFVFGLEGETKKTYELDYIFLEGILEKKLLLRRINLRQIIPIPGTRMYKIGSRIISKNKHKFKQFKRQVKENIERPLLKKMLPNGIILKNIFTESYRGKLTYGRQIGSYPLLVGIPGVLPLHTNLDVKITDYGYRSVTAVPFPLYINTAQRETIEALPDIGQKRAVRILAKRPFKDKKNLINALDDPNIGNKILRYISLK